MLIVGELYNSKMNEWLFADKKSYFTANLLRFAGRISSPESDRVVRKCNIEIVLMVNLLKNNVI